MPREALDAPENLPKQAPRQVALGQWVSASGRIKCRACRTRRERQNQPVQEIGEIVGDDAPEQPHLIGPEAVAGEPEDLLRDAKRGRLPLPRTFSGAIGISQAIEPESCACPPSLNRMVI